MDEPVQPAREPLPDHADYREMAILPRTMGMRDRGLMRMAMVVLTAAAITSVLLFWIINPR